MLMATANVTFLTKPTYTPCINRPHSLQYNTIAVLLLSCKKTTTTFAGPPPPVPQVYQDDCGPPGLVWWHQCLPLILISLFLLSQSCLYALLITDSCAQHAREYLSCHYFQIDASQLALFSQSTFFNSISPWIYSISATSSFQKQLFEAHLGVNPVSKSYPPGFSLGGK